MAAAVMLRQVDPHLSRTVVVSTKLDTRLPQFARGHDVELFLRPPGRLLEPGMLGGCPFFTCAHPSPPRRIRSNGRPRPCCRVGHPALHLASTCCDGGQVAGMAYMSSKPLTQQGNIRAL